MTTPEHWAHFDALVAKLEAMPDAQFDYGRPFLVKGCGCVAAHALQLAERPRGSWIAGPADLVRILGVTPVEAKALYAPGPLTAGQVLGPTPAALWARLGPVKRATKADALRRLAVLATRYDRTAAA